MHDNLPHGPGGTDKKRSIVSLVLNEITRDLPDPRIICFGGPDPALVHKMRDAALAARRDALGECVAQMRAGGLSAACIAELYVPLVARRLGDEWVSDAINFREVTLGAARLQSLLWCLAPDWAHTGALVSCGRQPVLVAVPAGSQHTLGATLLAGQLRYRGVPVQLEIGFDGGEGTMQVASNRFAALFISAAGCASLDKLELLVQKARRSYPRTPIVLGGNVTEQMADTKERTGADFVTSDVDEAMAFCSLGVRQMSPAAERAG